MQRDVIKLDMTETNFAIGIFGKTSYLFYTSKYKKQFMTSLLTIVVKICNDVDNLDIKASLSNLDIFLNHDS